MFEGPDNLWEVHGWCSWVAKAWINSASLLVDGTKLLTFHDGHTIKYNNTADSFSNLFVGHIGH